MAKKYKEIFRLKEMLEIAKNTLLQQEKIIKEHILVIS